MTESQAWYITDLIDRAKDSRLDVYEIEGELATPSSIPDQRASEIIDELKELIHEGGL